MKNTWLVLVATLVVAAILGFWAGQPPAPVSATAPIDQFSAERAMADVRIIAAHPHPTGSAEDAAVRAYLIGRLQGLGFTVRTVVTPLPDKPRERLRKWGSAVADTAVATSIVALRPGRDPASPAVLVMAHHDSVWASPGAADDTAGVAATLELARAIPAASQQRDLAILFSDAEELGLVGAAAFFAPAPKGDPLAGRIGAVVDLESRGGGGIAQMFETGPGNGAMIDLFAANVRHPAANSLAVKIYELLPNSTDFTPAKKRGLPGFNFAFIGDARLYHSPLATPDALDQRALQHIGGQALDVTRALVTAPALPPVRPDVVFSDVLGLFVIAYPAGFGWLVLGASLVAVIIAARRRTDWTPRGMLMGGLDLLVFVLAAGLLLYGGNLLSGADGPTNYYDRLAALPRLETQAVLLFGAGLALALAMAPRRREQFGGWLGLAAVNLAIGLAVQALLPAAAPVLAWPLLVASLALAITPTGRLLPALAAIFGLAFAGLLAHFLLLGIGGTTPGALAIFAPLTLLLVWPLLPPVKVRPALLTALLLSIAAGGIAVSVRLDPMAPSIPPYNPRG